MANTLLARNEPQDCYNSIVTLSTFFVSLGYNMDGDGSGANVTPGTTHQFRLVALNGTGTSHGNTLTLTTLALAAPQLSAPTRLPDGAFQFRFTSVPGVPHTTLASTNVTLTVAQWTVLGPAMGSPANSGQFQFTDFDAINLSVKFYQIRSP
jgi:hypothetical protein